MFNIFKKIQDYISNEMTALAAETYTIKPGDTIARIAKNDAQYMKAILDANPTVNPNKLRPGQKIILPVKPQRPNQSMKISPSLLDVLKKYEGRPDHGHKGKPYLKAYDDGFGNATIGWGHNLGKISPRTVPPINEAKAEELLRTDVETASAFIRRNVSTRLTQGQFDALVSLTFNAGPQAVYNTKLFKAVEQGNLHEAARLFPTTLIGTNQGGLQIRRQEESTIFRN